MKPNQTIMFFGIKPTKQKKNSNIKTEPNKTTYGFGSVSTTAVLVSFVSSVLCRSAS